MPLRRRIMYLALALGVLFLGAVAATIIVTTTTAPSPYFQVQNAIIGFLVMAIWMGYSWALLIGGVIVFLWWTNERREEVCEEPASGPADILARRYAAGEISAEEFQRMRREIDGSPEGAA